MARLLRSRQLAHRAVRPLVWPLLDTRDDRRGVLLPPRRLLAETSSPTRQDFVHAGATAVREMVRIGGLAPDSTTLEIESGAGRMAIPLTRYLRPEGRYEGLGSWAPGVDWCQRKVTPAFPNFRFRLADIGDPMPYPDAGFDFFIACTINHLQAGDVQRFAVEAGRLLRRGGTYFGTWYLVDDVSEASLPGRYRPVACHEEEARATLESAGLVVRHIVRGAWTGASDAVSVQDVVVASATGRDVSSSARP